MTAEIIPIRKTSPLHQAKKLLDTALTQVNLSNPELFWTLTDALALIIESINQETKLER